MPLLSDYLLSETPAGETPIAIHQTTPEKLEALLAELSDTANKWVKAQRFSAKPGSHCVVPDAHGAMSAVLFGADTGSDAPHGGLALGKLPGLLPNGVFSLAGGFDDLDQAALAWCLGCYRFERYKASSKEMPRLIAPQGCDIDEVKRIADGVQLTRDLVNTPASDMGPSDLSAAAKALADTHGAAMTEIVGDDLINQNFPMIHAVGRAADWAAGRAPRLIDFTWGDPSHPKVTLVGKGVVFDTGGLDIKPAPAMLLMKKDMGGAANVLGLASMIMAAKMPVRLRVLIPAVENAISGNAFRPGDVLPSRKGLTVEIGNTDAEGRLVLADALTLAGEEQPDLVIDMATLTGAARVAVGPDLAPFYCADDAFAKVLGEVGDALDDPVWRMPLRRRYRSLLDSKIADINHISSGAFAGSITAALFLQEFTEGASTWVHLDIFAWTPSARPARPEGGEAQGIRALYRLLTDRYTP